MQARDQTPAYEVYCNHCNVSFPVGARHCLHCGGRLSKQRAGVPPKRIGMSRKRGGVPQPRGGPAPQRGESAPPPAGMVRETEMIFGPVEESPEEAGRRSPFSPIALIWVLLFVAGTIYRACASG